MLNKEFIVIISLTGLSVLLIGLAIEDVVTAKKDKERSEETKYTSLPPARGECKILTTTPFTVKNFDTELSIPKTIVNYICPDGSMYADTIAGHIHFQTLDKVMFEEPESENER